MAFEIQSTEMAVGTPVALSYSTVTSSAPLEGLAQLGEEPIDRGLCLVETGDGLLGVELFAVERHDVLAHHFDRHPPDRRAEAAHREAIRVRIPPQFPPLLPGADALGVQPRGFSAGVYRR